MFSTKYTDLAAEFTKNTLSCADLTHADGEICGLEVGDTVIGEETAKSLGKPAGRYLMLYTGQSDTKRQAEALSKLIKEILPDGRCLAVGLGNPMIASDSLGWQTAGEIIATTQYLHSKWADGKESNGIRDICVIRTNVAASSGIESLTQVKAAREAVKADFVLCIDSLACNDSERLCSTVQITDTGLAPGKGAGGDLSEINEKNVGVPVIAVGVPTVMSADIPGLMTTRRDIDISVKRFSHVIAAAVNKAFLPALSDEDIFELSHF